MKTRITCEAPIPEAQRGANEALREMNRHLADYLLATSQANQALFRLTGGVSKFRGRVGSLQRRLPKV